MADLESKLREKHTKKKRTQRGPEETERPFKTHRIDISEKENEPKEVSETSSKLEEGGPWRNLQLILAIQNKEIDIQKKVELAFDFVKSRVKAEGNDIDRDFETVSKSRLIVFLNDWIQSLLISSEKKIKLDGKKPLSEVSATCLDFRCWDIFKFCLQEALKLHVSLNFARNLLRVISCIARYVLSLLNDDSVCSTELFFRGEGYELFAVVLDCVKLVFSSHGGLLNENLELWVLTIDPVLKLVHKVYSMNLDGRNVGIFAIGFSMFVLEPFAKFLRVHPIRKTGFRNFVDKLLEPLLHAVGILHLRIDGNGSDPGCTRDLLKLVEEVLSHGLFHPVHIDGFMSLHITEKYATFHEGKSKSPKTDIKSYHKHLFDKLERIMAAKKVLALDGVGELFHLLVDRVKRQNRVSVLSAGTTIMGKTVDSRLLEDDLSGHMSKLSSGSRVIPEINYYSSNLNAETRKSLFDFFVQIMEPLLLEIDSYLQAKLELGPLLLDVLCIFKCINNLLASFMHEKVYVKTEDTSEGACLEFLKKVYNVIMSFATNLLWLSKDGLDNGTHMEMLTLLAKELLVAVGYLLEIEYEVIGNDLVSIWLMMLSFLAIGLSLTLDRCSLTPKILGLGCQLVNLYSELRQVNSTIFALCKALRLMTSHDSDGDIDYARFLCCTTSLSCEAYAKSVRMLLCSVEFKLAIHNAIKSIPEGQASGCIRQLTVDISESMEWMKISCPVVEGKEFGKQSVRSCSTLGFDLQAELFGRGLSEMYTLVLDSLTVTTGNSNLLGVSIKDLMTVIRPCISNLVGLQPDSVSEFLFSVTGRTFDNGVAGNKTHLQKFRMSTHWIFVFFFRLYMSCRSLCRQAISLMAPDSSKKMSAVMGDSFTAYSGKDWMERTDWTDEGYFSWIIQPSASLVDVIQSVSGIYLQDSFADCCPLIYVLHAVALQRLVDLNRQIKSFEYLLLSNNNLVQINLLDDTGLSLCRKKCRKWERRISVLRLEAAGLTDFIMGYVALAANDQHSISTSDDATSKDTCPQALHESDEWDLGVCSVNKKSLPTAIWWIVCQNIDIWRTHAAKKKLKVFLSLLIHSSLPNVTSSFEEVQKRSVDESGQLKEVTVHQISSELLSDSILYEHRFVRRHFASRFCRILEKSAISIFSDFSFGDVDFKSSPKWPEVLSALDKSSVVSGNKRDTYDFFPVGKLISYSSNKLPTQICKDKKACTSTGMKFTACQSLLKLLCWMPKGYLDSRSFSHYATHILHLERLVVGSLLECQSPLCVDNHYELFRLFVSCRKALKCIIMASCEEMTESSQCSPIPLLFEGSFPVLWLFKSVSVVAALQVAFSEDSASQRKDMIFSLMDHTSYVFLTLSKYQLSRAVQFFIGAEQPCKEEPNSDVAHEHSDLIESDPCLDSSNEFEAWKSTYLIGESLKEQTQSLLISVKEALCNAKVGVGVNVVDLNKLSSIVSCFSGFLWGLASAMNHTNAENSDHKTKLSRWKCVPVSELNLCISVFVDFINFFLHMFLVEDDQCPSSLCETQSLQNLELNREPLGVEEFPLKGIGAETDSSCGIQQQKSGAATSCSASSELHGDYGNARVHRKRSQSKNVNFASSVLAEVDSFDFKHLNKPLLQSLLKGNHPEAAFFLRQLLIASSAILRLNLQLGTPLSSTLVPTFIGISQVLLLELADMVEVPQPFSFVWLDGVLKYLEELGSRFPLTNPSLSRNVYAKLIELHLRAIGKCISLQGKKATLASHETESSTKTLHGHIGLSEGSLSHGPYCLDEFKARLRMSFKVFISRPSELHLLSAIQAIERALVGVQEGCITIYEVNTGSADGGKVSPIVAAGIDCLDLVLEYVSGRNRVSVVKRHMQSLIAGLFNIILHLQSPLIFYRRLMNYKGDNDPDPGSVILMCVEVLTRVSGKHALFQLDSWQVGQSLHIPSALFQDFHQLRLSRARSSSFLFLDNQQHDPVASMNSCFVDRQFSIDLFAACCRLLYTILKHRKSECERCIALLEDSVCVLLHCLETPDTESVVRKGLFSWEVQEGVKCACFLRRIYEEIRQQKDVFGQHCFKFLANYIRVYSGYGPLKTGIRREIDAALRPGVYALVDACSADDLQYLHTVFGEGPCRNTLATLQHDYKLNFQYEGKV